MPTKPKITSTVAFVYLAIFAIMELPIRLILQPDPWLLTANHWYFEQPLRLIIELTIVLTLFITILKTSKSLLTIQKRHVLLLAISTIASVLIFGVLEFEQLKSSFNVEFDHWLMWLLSGVAIGVGQELLYRGLLFTSLNQYFSSRISGIVTTFVFVLAPLHSVRLWDYGQKNQIAVVLILIGIYAGVSTLFQWLRNHTGSITIPALVHGAGNGITWVAVFA